MSSNQQILSFVGQVVGSYFGPVGAAIGGTIGSYVGASLDTLPDQFGPKLQDRKIQTSSYGVPIPLAYGTVRVAGNMTWFKDNMLTEVATTDDTGGKSGQPAQSVTIYSYYASFALLLSGTRSRSVRRIWSGGMLIYDGGLINQVPPNFGLTFYRGSDDQLPDPLIEAERGVGKTPAFRGKSYLVFDSMPTEKTGWPVNFTVELVGEGRFSLTEEELGEEAAVEAFASAQRLDGSIIIASQDTEGLRLSVLDQKTGAILLSVDHDLTADADSADSQMCYVPPLNEVWLAGGTPGIYRFDATSLAYLGDIFNGAGGGSSRMVWDSVRQRVFHRPNAGWLRAGGQNVLLAGAGSVVDIINADRCGYIDLNFELGFEAMDAIVGNVPGNSSADYCAAAYDPMRRRYVVFSHDDDCRTVTDSTSPVVTLEATGAFNDAINVGVLYDASTDCILKFGVVVGLVQVTVFDAETFEVKIAYDEVDEIDRLRFGVVDAYPDTTQTGRVFVVGVLQPWAFNYFGSKLADCVTDLCERSGMESADIDVSELTQDLRGYLVSSIDSARPAVEQLAKVFSFNGVEEDDKIVFKMRGADPVATIARTDCGAIDGSQSDQPSPAITATRAQQLDLPKFCTVTAADPARDLEPGTQQSQRQAASAGQVVQFSTAVTLSATEQVRLANLIMYDAWTSRTSLKFSTDMSFTRLMPGDVVTLDGMRCLLLSRQSGGAMIDWEAVSDDASVLTQYGIGVDGDFPHQVPPQLVPTYNVLLDTSLLSDTENTPGAYDGAWGLAPHWRGGILYRSTDGGISWPKVAVFPRPGVSVGYTIDVLGDFAEGNVFDETNSLTVRMRNGTPYSSTRDALLAGSNAAAVKSGDGWEIIQYRDVATNGDGTFTLRGLLRGRRGTEWAMADHAEGDVVVLLAASMLRDFAIGAGEIGVSQLIKAVSIGSTLSDTNSEEIVITSERLKPFSPVDFRVARDVDTNNATLSWKRRTRLSCRYIGGIYVPLGEDSESYDVEITETDHVTVLRTFSGLTESEVEYTVEQQLEDGIDPGDPICVRIYQVSAIVGRGHPLIACSEEVIGGEPEWPITDTRDEEYTGYQYYGPWTMLRNMPESRSGLAAFLAIKPGDSEQKILHVAGYHEDTSSDQADGHQAWLDTDARAWELDAEDGIPGSSPSGTPAIGYGEMCQASVGVYDGKTWLIGRPYINASAAVIYYDENNTFLLGSHWNVQTDIDVPWVVSNPGPQYGALIDGVFYFPTVGKAINLATGVSSDIASIKALEGFTSIRNSGAEVVGGKIYVLGCGDLLNNGDQAYLYRTYVYDPADDSITRLSDAPETLYYATCVTLDGKIHAIGGRVGTINVVAYSDRHYVYNPADDTYTEKAALPPVTYFSDGRVQLGDSIFATPGRSGFSAVVKDGLIYIAGAGPGIGFGGIIVDPNQPYELTYGSMVFVYDPALDV